MKKKVLWIEDSAFDEISFLATPVHLTGEFDLQMALNATDAVAKLQASEFDAVVVDIRIPPGSDRRWIKVYDGSNRGSRLGLMLLQLLLGRSEFEWKLQFSRPAARDRLRYGVLSVENVAGDVAELEVLYRDKSGDDDSALLRLIREILSRRAAGEGNGNGHGRY